MAEGLVLMVFLTFHLLLHVSHSYVIKDSGYSQGSDPDPGSGTFGSVLPGGSGLGLQGVKPPSHHGVQEAPALSPYSSGLVGPAVSSYHPAVPSVGSPVEKEPSWEVAPQSPEVPYNDDYAAGGFLPEGFSSGIFDVSMPAFTPGEISHVENTFEHGSNDRESENQGELHSGPYGFSPDGSVAEFVNSPEALSVGNFPGPPGYPEHYWYPYYDWMFLTGQYPPGTVSHFSSTFDQGNDDWQDSHYDKYYHDHTGPVIPTYPRQQVKVGAQA